MWTLDLDRPAECLDAILQAEEPGSPARIGSATSVVADREAEARIVEIEIQLESHPCVREVAVVGTRDERWGEAPVAFVVADGAVQATELETWCRERLAAYKVPRRFNLVSELPRNASGKVAKRVLRAQLED